MNFWELFRYEVSYQLRRSSTWIYCLLFLGVAASLALSMTKNVRAGDYLMNAPIVVMFTTAGAGLICLLVTAAVAGDAATHDTDVKIDRLLYTLPISKLSYLGARFLAAFTVCALVLAFFQVGLFLLAALPVMDESFFGPVKPIAYISPYFVMGLPTLFASTALLFFVALLSRHALTSFLVGVVLFFSSFFLKEVVAEHMGYWKLARMADIGGLTILGELRRTLTPAVINTQLIALDGWLLLNRILWLLIGTGCLVLTYVSFRFTHPGESKNWWRRLAFRNKATEQEVISQPVTVPQVKGRFGFSTTLYQVYAIAVQSFKEIILQWGGLVILGTGAFMVFMGQELVDGPLGVPLLATTGRVAAVLGDTFHELIVVSLITLYTGQLVWRERDSYLSEFSDAAPVSSWARLLGKFLGVTMMLFTFQAVQLLAGILIQVGHDYYTFEPGLYLRILFGLQLVDYLLFAALVMFVHVLVNQKYVGHIIIFLIFFYTVFAEELKIEHKMLIYGSDTGWSYSDMSGFGHHIWPWIWFKLYWAGLAFMLVILARLLWVRGKELSVRERYKQAVKRFTPLQVKLGIAAVLLVSTCGSFVFYNTNILHQSYSNFELAARRANYERQYGKYRDVPQPLLSSTSLNVAFYPETNEATVQGVYTLINQEDTPIAAIHVSKASEVGTTTAVTSRKATVEVNDKELGYSIHRLESPLQSGDSLQLSFDLLYQPKGFSSNGVSNTVVRNGSFFMNQEWLPAIGYQAEKELKDDGERKLHNLGARSTGSQAKEAEKVSAALGRTRLEAIVSTAAGQLAIAPGTLVKSWEEKGRHYFHYVADTPIRNIYPFASAAYQVRESQWNNVSIQLFHHPGHTLNVQKMEQSVKASLDYYTKHFGPYPHTQLKLVEYPSQGTSATSYPGTIVFTENLGALNAAADHRNFDLPFAVMAHEVAHQWWGNQLIPADVEGAVFLSESLSWYSALGVVEEAQGTKALRRLMDVMRSIYLTPRSRADVPLLQAYDPFLGHRKGPFAMYALREYMGEKRVNKALRQLLEKYGSGAPVLPTSHDLYRELKAAAPDSLQYLLRDLFEVNTFWELTAKQARTKALDGNKWQLTLGIEARKVKVDEAGKETTLPMNDLIEIGVYATGTDDESGELYLQKHRIREGRQQVSLVVNGKPATAGIDPRHLLIDTTPDDNLLKVTLQE